MSFANIVSLALATTASLPCDRAEPADIHALIGGPAIPVPPDEMGEETAPGCMWSTHRREREVKLTVWSKDELPVVGQSNATSYFERQLADALSDGSVEELQALGDRAFLTGFASKPGTQTSGLIVILKGGRLYVFDFNRTNKGTERAFVAKLMK